MWRWGREEEERSMEGGGGSSAPDLKELKKDPKPAEAWNSARRLREGVMPPGVCPARKRMNGTTIIVTSQRICRQSGYSTTTSSGKDKSGRLDFLLRDGRCALVKSKGDKYGVSIRQKSNRHWGCV